MLKHLINGRNQSEAQHEILTIKMAAFELYERMMIAYWTESPVSREYHLNSASAELKKLADIIDDLKSKQGADQ